jgi:hypothetical protein
MAHPHALELERPDRYLIPKCFNFLHSRSQSPFHPFPSAFSLPSFPFHPFHSTLSARGTAAVLQPASSCMLLWHLFDGTAKPQMMTIDRHQLHPQRSTETYSLVATPFNMTKVSAFVSLVQGRRNFSSVCLSAMWKGSFSCLQIGGSEGSISEQSPALLMNL